MECSASRCARLATQETTDGPLCHHHYMAWRKWGHVGSAYPSTCTVDGCTARHLSGGLCSRHYKLKRETGSTDDRPSRRRQRQTCTVDGCDLGVEGHELCSKHYTRMRRYGSTDLPPKPVPHPKLCAQCGKDRPPQRRTYCSDVCATLGGFHTRRSGSRIAQLRRYGITVEQYDQMLERQGGGCAICGSLDPKSKRESFAVDHCHESGRVRGLLCLPCNSGLGHFGDDVERMRAAIEYLTS